MMTNVTFIPVQMRLVPYNHVEEVLIKQFTLLVSTIKEQGILLCKSFWLLDIKIVDFFCVKYTLNTCL